MIVGDNLRVLSGIQPSGMLHLGNYFGMMSRMIHYQKNNELFCFIANYHALTSSPGSEQLSINTFNAACDFLALGLDPEKSTFWIQSDVPEVTELTWILSSQVNLGLMDRSTSYKDKIAKGLKSNMGLYSYPVLMAADILLFDSEIVPVGKDQKQHLEITRDIANRFNNSFGDIFKIPEPDIEKENQLIPGIDGKKMSKSYNNTIPIFDSDNKIRKKIMKIITDTADINSPKNIDNPLFNVYCLFLDDEGKKILKERYNEPGLRYGDLKQELFERVMDYFAPFREKRSELISKPDFVYEVLEEGASKARLIANNVLDRVRGASGINYKL